jgi:adenylate cyclase class IV
LNNASVDELLEVLRLAHKYDVKFVFKKAKYCLQAAVVSLDICEKIMRFIKVDNTITDVDDLASTLQSFLAKTFSPLDKTWQTTSFKTLCKPSVRYLLSSNNLVTASENTIFHALMN